MYSIPKKPLFKIGEVGMNALFLFFAVIYAWLFIQNVRVHYGTVAS